MKVRDHLQRGTTYVRHSSKHRIQHKIHDAVHEWILSQPRETIYAIHTQQWTLVVPCSVDTIKTEISKPLFGMAASCTITNILSNRIHDHISLDLRAEFACRHLRIQEFKLSRETDAKKTILFHFHY